MFRWSNSNGRAIYINAQKIISLTLEGEHIYARFDGMEEKILNCGSVENAKKIIQTIIDQINNNHSTSEEFQIMKQEIIELKQTVKLQQDQLESLNHAIMYAPGGPIFQISQQNYQTRAYNSSTQST